MKRMTKKTIAARRDATRQRDRFVAEYLKDFNSTQAAIRAGYPRKSAHLIGRRLLEEPEVVAAVEQGKREAAAADQRARHGDGRRGRGARKSRGPMGGDNAEGRAPGTIVIVLPDNGPLPAPSGYPAASVPTPSRNSELPSPSNGSPGETECNTCDGEKSTKQTEQRHDHRRRAVNVVAASRDAMRQRDRFVAE